MRKSIITVCVLSGLFLSGCDFWVVRAIGLSPERSYQPEEADIALQSDFKSAIEVVEGFVFPEGFEEVVPERQPFHRVYQESPGPTAFRITVTGYPPYKGITVAIFEVQTRRPSEALDKIYTALAARLKAEFGDRIVVDEPGTTATTLTLWVE